MFILLLFVLAALTFAQFSFYRDNANVNKGLSYLTTTTTSTKNNNTNNKGSLGPPVGGGRPPSSLGAPKFKKEGRRINVPAPGAHYETIFVLFL